MAKLAVDTRGPAARDARALLFNVLARGADGAAVSASVTPRFTIWTAGSATPR